MDVSGIGPKFAAEIINEHGSVEAILADVGKAKSLRKRVASYFLKTAVNREEDRINIGKERACCSDKNNRNSKLEHGTEQWCIKACFRAAELW